MRIIFVNPPNHQFDKSYLAPPLGLLTLASYIKKNGYEVIIKDFNLEVLEDNQLANSNFYEYAVSQILDLSVDVICFTSMCLESHVSLEIARKIKQTLPDVTTIFGGTHFGTIAERLLSEFDFVDYVVSGEAETALNLILKSIEGKSQELPQNVFFHSKEGKNISNGKEPITVLNAEQMPFPAYEIVDIGRYFAQNTSNLLHYEAGRGCVYKCEFCYSPFHYGDAVRHKLPSQIVTELKKLAELGAEHIFFVQDNFLNSTKWAVKVCQAIAEANLSLTWECYTTFPQLKKDIVNLMSEAKCIGVFTGIDAVAQTSQKKMNKPFLKNWEKTKNKLKYCLDKGMLPICAFLLEPENEERENYESTIYTVLECLKLGIEVRLNVLSFYNKTGLMDKLDKETFSYSSIKSDLMLDTLKIVEQNQFAEKSPSLFPYHSTYFDVEEWELFVTKIHTTTVIINGLKDTLFRYVVIEENELWKTLNFVNKRFIGWVRRLPKGKRNEKVLYEFAKEFFKGNLSDSVKLGLNIELSQHLFYKPFWEKRANMSLNVKGVKKDRIDMPFIINLNDIKVPKAFSDEKKLFLDTNNFMIARLGLNGKIEIVSANEELYKEITKLISAAHSGEIITINEEKLDYLNDNGWIRLN